MTEIGEKILVVAVFKNGEIFPRKFVWNGKELKINKIALNYTKRVGSCLLKFFSVNVLGTASAYELSFNTDSMIWKIEKIETFEL